MDDAATQSKKRRLNSSQSSDNSGDEGKKRGRPRVEKKDESAADRRRTQIRKAQRAYRQRKESTLEELRRRVADLSNVLELMNQAFVDCCERLAGSGLSPDQASHIRDTEMQFGTLMRCVRNSEEDCSPELAAPIRRPSTEARLRADTLEPQNVPSWMDESVLATAKHGSVQRPLIGIGYGLVMDNSQSSGPQRSVSSQQVGSARPSTHPGLQFETPIPASLAPIRTYSFHETTFARRLHRASLEAGYSLALDPTRSPEAFNRSFRLSLLLEDRSKLTVILKELLDRSTHDSLDSDIPMIHVGGAGTHYSRKDKFGVLQPKKQVQQLGIIGPQALSILQRASPMTDLSVEILGFEGEWFDPHDVEGYLAEKGIFVDPGSSFAEADVDFISAQLGKSSSASSSTTTMSPELQAPVRGTPDSASVPYSQTQLEHTGDLTANTDEWPDFSMLKMTDIGFSDASTGSWLNFLMPGEAIKQLLPSGSQWDDSVSSQYMSEDPNSGFVKSTESIGGRNKKMLIDVSKFLKILTCAGCCLGKQPGYRRSDVDRALVLSAFDPF